MHTILPEPLSVTEKLSPLATDPPCQLNVLGHDGHALGVDGAQVCVLEQTDQVCFRSLLQRKDGMALEAQISLHKYNRMTNKLLCLLQNCKIT